MTVDVDFIVPDVEAAHRLLLSRGYAPSSKQMLAVVDRGRNVTIDLLPAGHCLQRICRVPFPMPHDTKAVMLPVTLEELISLKLDSWKANPTRRGQDRVDVQKLIVNNRLPRDLKVAEPVRAEYERLWDEIEAEPPGPDA